PSVMMLPLRHPITVAKEMATLDFLAPGRVIMAVGLGADEHEAAAFNVPLKQRGTMTEEGIAILRKLWAAPDVSHHGKYYQFEHVTITPRPAKKIDIWVGGRSDAALRRGARVGGRLVAPFFIPPKISRGDG